MLNVKCYVGEKEIKNNELKRITVNDELINKIVTVTNNNSGTVGSYTTAGNTGFTEISSDIIYENVKYTIVPGDVFYTISFKDGKCIAKLEKDGTIDDCIKDFTKDLKIPVISNFQYGHIPSRHIIPLGKTVKLTSTPSICSISW